MSTYVISDIHGQYELFMAMLKKINFQPTDTLYVLGDMVDRGKDSIKVVEHIMSQDNMLPIMGNHEDMLIYGIRTYGFSGQWGREMIQGTDSYKLYMELRRLRYKSSERVRKFVSYLQSLPLYYSISVAGKPYLLVHAGIRNADISSNSRDDLLWIREDFIESEEKFPYTVVFGHTPTSYMDERGKIWKMDDRIGIDCGAGFMGGRLACLRLDDMEEYYI